VLKKKNAPVARARSESVLLWASGQLMCINYQLICKAKIKIVLRGESCGRFLRAAFREEIPLAVVIAGSEILIKERDRDMP